MKSICVFMLICFLAALPVPAAARTTAAKRYPAGRYSVVSSILPVAERGMPRKWSFVIAQPEDNIYQKVSISGRFRGKSVALRDNCGRVILFSGRKNKMENPLQYRFDVTLYKLQTNWKKIKSVPSPSGKYPEFTRPNLPWIAPAHPEIKRISDDLRRKSSGTLAYIRNCYKYVTGNFKYLNPNTGLHSLDKIIRSGGGDCGNLSSIFISLLRCAGIPARHVVGRRVDGSNHVWSEFYLEKYGWFPADVTVDLGRKNFRCFGNWDDSCVVMHRDVGFELPGFKDFGKSPLLQGYYYRYSGNRMTIKHSFSGDRR